MRGSYQIVLNIVLFLLNAPGELPFMNGGVFQALKCSRPATAKYSKVIALRKAIIAYKFGLSECNEVNKQFQGK